MNTEPIRENKMGVMPVPRLLLSMSGPMMISMLIQALYNVVDSMFVSYISEAALTAVSLAYPVQNLMIAVAAGTGVGAGATASLTVDAAGVGAAAVSAGPMYIAVAWPFSTSTSYFFPFNVTIYFIISVSFIRSMP